MFQRMSATVIMAAVLAVLAVGLAGPAMAVAADSTVATPHARVVPQAATADVSLYGVACSDAKHCLAVGQETSASNLGSDFARSWNGRTWRTLPVPSPGILAGLNGVACAGPADCIAVGSYATAAGPSRPLAIAWNGKGWRVLRTPGPDNSELLGVSCTGPGRCVAVGDTLNANNRRTLAEAWNGTSWRLLPAADTHSVDSQLHGVSCTGPRFCMAAGTSFSAAGFTITLAESWNGARWRIVGTASPGNQFNALNSVSCASAASCVTVGTYLRHGQAVGTTFAEKWDGRGWRILKPVNPGLGGTLISVSCAGAAHCIAVGEQAGQSGNPSPLAEAWNGTAWRLLPTGNLGKAIGNLTSLSCPRADRCMAVGDKFAGSGNGPAQPLAEAWNGSRWLLTPG